jgi:hypothetical protein
MRRVCRKVLHDHSVSAERLEKRQQALLELSVAYKAAAVDTEKGLEDLLNRVGAQSGLFSTAEAASTAPTSEAGTAGPADSAASSSSSTAASSELDKQTLLAMLIKSQSMSTKELITGIDSLGGAEKRKLLLEKNDLRIEYRSLLLQKLSLSDLRELAAMALEPEAQDLDQETLTRLLATA